MLTKLLPATEETVTLAKEIILSGGVVGVPTETVYGLAANALDEHAVSEIFKAKGRPQDNPLIVHIADMDMLKSIAKDVPSEVYKLAEAFWPGPFTVVLNKSDIIPSVVSGGLDTVAVRMPENPVALALIRECGVPLAAPSANLSGSPSPTSAQHVFDDLNGKIPLIIDGGESRIGLESTVLSLTEEVPKLLRPGGIPPARIESVIGKIDMDKSVLGRLDSNEKASSPGMKYKHYSPRAELILLEGTKNQYIDYVNNVADEKTAALCFDGEQDSLNVPSVCYGNPQNPEEQASRIFSSLRKLNDLSVDTVFAHCPSSDGVSLAVFNRLIRAADFRIIRLPVVIGLTGPTGAGKSYAGELLEKCGVRTVDADKISKNITDSLAPELINAFGSGILYGDGAVNRKALFDKAFGSDESHEKLNLITHPAIIAEIDREIGRFAAGGASRVAVDAALLIESGYSRQCDAVVSVLCDRELRKKRIMERDGIDGDAAEKRINSQQADEYYVNNSDFVINGHTADIEGIKALLGDIGMKVKFSRK